ncbi:hypothetical protein ACLOJK_019219 [Asimina triloba]
MSFFMRVKNAHLPEILELAFAGKASVVEPSSTGADDALEDTLAMATTCVGAPPTRLASYLSSERERASQLPSSKDQLAMLKARERLATCQQDIARIEGDVSSREQELSQLSSSIHDNQQEETSMRRLLVHLRASKVAAEEHIQAAEKSRFQFTFVRNLSSHHVSSLHVHSFFE